MLFKDTAEMGQVFITDKTAYRIYGKIFVIEAPLPSHAAADDILVWRGTCHILKEIAQIKFINIKGRRQKFQGKLVTQVCMDMVNDGVNQAVG